ncbi:MAG: glycoside hydrolase family 2 protein [Ilumatobacter sp.]|uniref:glycoside hydrolase family 2 protein n=1 Tax=Ilumatobacter sp. TaxID=1967498 RepID=UPI00391A2D69
MELAGRWVATEADDDVRRFGIGLDADDSSWLRVDVPGHWQHTPAFAASNGPLMYRHRFACDPPPAGRRRWITFDGVFYQADAWLDGAYLGDPEGYFFPHSFDVTQLARIGDEHVLAVEVACAPQSTNGRTNITGILQSWRGLPSGWNPGGLWRSVRMYDTGPVRIERLRALCRDADVRRAHVRFTAILDSADPREIVVRTLRDGELVDEHPAAVASGENELEWTIDIRDPDLWWPFELGEQALTTLTVEIVADGELSDQRFRRTGLRQIVWNDWVCSVNGEPLFLRGTNLMPITAGLGDTTDELIERDLQHVLDLGLNCIRVHGHIGRRCLYDRADELGIVILQDFPLVRTHARSTRGRAVSQATATVDTLGHHPSIALWSAHSEPTSTSTEMHPGWRRRLRDVAAQQLPSWNKSVLDRWVKRAFERADTTRTTIAHSGVAPHFPQLDGTDRHLSYGWRHGDAEDLARRAKLLPRSVRFVSEFGSESVPDHTPFVDDLDVTRRWPDLDWQRLVDDVGYQHDVFDELLPPDTFPSFDEWRETTQLYQSHVLKVQIEALRRLKYRPTGGFCFSSLADPAPAISSSVLDHLRSPKDAYAVVRAACAPVIVVADPLPDWVNPGDRLDVDVHLVNDRRTPIDHAIVDATIAWAGGSELRRFGGPVQPDDVVKVATVTLTVPDTLGELAIELRATDGDDELATNRYSTAVVLPTQ